MRIFKSISKVHRYYIPKSIKLCSIFIPYDQQDPLIQWSAYLDQEGQGGWSSAGEPQLKLERSVSGRKTFAQKTNQGYGSGSFKPADLDPTAQNFLFTFIMNLKLELSVSSKNTLADIISVSDPDS